MTTDILFLITARGGSKRIPGKNLKRIGGLSLLGYKARSAQKSKNCSRLVVSTDDPKIQDEAVSCGVEVLFTRPAHLASDTATSDDVVLHAIDYFETTEKRQYDAIMLLEPSTPFARAGDYDAAIEIYRHQNAALVVGIRRTDVNSIFTGPLGVDGNAEKIVSKFSGKSGLRTQEMEPEFTMNGAFYLIDRDAIKSTGLIYGTPERTFGHPMDRAHSIEIDDAFDLRMAEFLVETGDINLKDWQ